MDLRFPGKQTTTAISCIPHDSVYMPGPCAGKSENGGLRERRVTKKVPKRRFRQKRKKEFLWLHYDEEKEKMFCTVCKHVEEDKAPFILNQKCSFLVFSHVVVC